MTWKESADLYRRYVNPDYIDLLAAFNYGRSFVKAKGTALYDDAGNKYLDCLAGFSFFYVSSAGELCPCDFVPVSFGNVYQRGFLSAFDKARTVFMQPCSKCMTGRIMGGTVKKQHFPLVGGEADAAFAGLESSEPSNLMKMILH